MKSPTNGMFMPAFRWFLLAPVALLSTVVAFPADEAEADREVYELSPFSVETSDAPAVRWREPA